MSVTQFRAGFSQLYWSMPTIKVTPQDSCNYRIGNPEFFRVPPCTKAVRITEILGKSETGFDIAFTTLAQIPDLKAGDWVQIKAIMPPWPTTGLSEQRLYTSVKIMKISHVLPCETDHEHWEYLLHTDFPPEIIDDGFNER